MVCGREQDQSRVVQEEKEQGKYFREISGAKPKKGAVGSEESGNRKINTGK